MCFNKAEESRKKEQLWQRRFRNTLSSFCFNNYNVLYVCFFFLCLFSIYYRKRYGLAYNLSKVPTSIKGYAFGARTAVRFKPISKPGRPEAEGSHSNINLDNILPLQLPTDKDFRKHQNRVAYLSLYYN
ncbi:hypothetical protein E2I00_019727 [Balaenoptera physalus]|uniref:Uncharacterized protein n=1 Tax=Balaenoptera physalus TaxID=9770 RepID=A0A643C8W8_BALPH|nr:hypothetical protein E2I00_019727 [Balaenoptera physalus]